MTQPVQASPIDHSGYPTLAARGFLVGFTANYIYTDGALFRSVVGGTFSACASLVDLVVRPLIDEIFGSNPDELFAKLIIREVVVLSIVSAGALAMSPFIGFSVTINVFGILCIRAALLVFSEARWARSSTA